MSALIANGKSLAHRKGMDRMLTERRIHLGTIPPWVLRPHERESWFKIGEAAKRYFNKSSRQVLRLIQRGDYDGIYETFCDGWQWWIKLPRECPLVVTRHKEREVVLLNGQTPIVYFMQAGDDFLKIGFSVRTGEMRKADIQRHCPLRIKVLATFPGNRRDEKQLHQRFRQFRLHNEWFKIEGTLKEFVASLTTQNGASALFGPATNPTHF